MKTKIPLAVARDVANHLIEQMAPHCKRIEVAGSIRRCKPDVGDLEIIAIPTVELYDLTDSWMSSHVIRPTYPQRWGAKLRSFCIDVKGLAGDIQVDLFLQPDPATFGVNMMIRTGSAEFSRKMVTKRSAGGFMPDGYQVRDARVWAGARLLETPEEADVFRIFGLDYVMPAQRTDLYKPKLGDAPSMEVELALSQATLF